MPPVDPDAFAHLSLRLRTSGPIRGRRGTPVLSIEGELDRSTVASPEWRATVAEAAGQPGDVVVLDLSRLYFLDLAGLAEFEKLAASLAAAGRRLALAAIRPRIREFLRQACADFGDEYTELDEQDGIGAGPAWEPVPARKPAVARPAAAGLAAA
ncbi:STAS domain-containing protein [Actinospica robiniae]|uniref:STAS domain-containing protein n=1 Tax=Actinospica robiniae TaxID=304901 RepID=UPI000411AF09|nr:STAS domain-containing protein [Actinospica robiniae]